jgi:hypothetical protein
VRIALAEQQNLQTWTQITWPEYTHFQFYTTQGSTQHMNNVANLLQYIDPRVTSAAILHTNTIIPICNKKIQQDCTSLHLCLSMWHSIRRTRQFTNNRAFVTGPSRIPNSQAVQQGCARGNARLPCPPSSRTLLSQPIQPRICAQEQTFRF